LNSIEKKKHLITLGQSRCNICPSQEFKRSKYVAFAIFSIDLLIIACVGSINGACCCSAICCGCSSLVLIILLLLLFD